MKKERMNIIYQVCKCIDKKSGENLVVLELSKITSICDYFVIASGTSSRQVKSIVDEIQDKLLGENIDLLHKEGYDDGRWVLLDYGDIVIHVFHEEEREFYNIEGIWRDADKLDVSLDGVTNC